MRINRDVLPIIPGTIAMFSGGAYVGARIQDGSKHSPLMIGALGGGGIALAGTGIAAALTYGAASNREVVRAALGTGAVTGAFFGTALLAGAALSASLRD